MSLVLDLLKRHKIMVLSLGGLVLCLSVLVISTQLLICDAGSLPGVKVALILKGSPYKTGDMVGIQGHPIPYAAGKNLLIKRILGFSGDRIEHKGKEIRLIPQNPGPHKEECQGFVLLNKTKEEKPLHPLEIRVVPEGYVFVAGDHPRSFDSRYLEFGLVHQSHIMGRTVSLW